MLEYFDGAAEYYKRYRPFYPEEEIAQIVSFFGLSSSSRVLDVGAGTGQLAIGLAPFVQEIIAVEPNLEMMKKGQELCEEHNIRNVTWVNDPIETCVDELGSDFQLATFGASFHWMNEETIFPLLDSIIAPNGGVAITGTSSIWKAEDGWEHAVMNILEDVIGTRKRSGAGGYQQSARKGASFVDMLRDSVFSQVEEHSFDVDQPWTIDSFIGRLLSTSYANPVVLADRYDDFVHRVEAELLRWFPNQEFTQELSYYLITAKRS